MSKECDHSSVGVIIEHSDSIALLKRAKPPIAFAPPAGHIDNHGAPEQAAIQEVYEELGLIIVHNRLIRTTISDRRADNPCPRDSEGYHNWWVYRVTEFDGELTPSTEETQGADWYNRTELQALADRTRSLLASTALHNDQIQNPGLEGVWLPFFIELGYVE